MFLKIDKILQNTPLSNVAIFAIICDIFYSIEYQTAATASSAFILAESVPVSV